MKLKLTSIALHLLAASIHATTINQWTFETSQPATAGPHISEAGSVPGQATSFHSASGATFSNPVGNGSGESFSANNWNAGDYWQFVVSTIGYAEIKLNWEQTSSRTGPRDFKLQYSVTGLSYSDFSSFIVLENNGSNGGEWGVSTYHPEYSFSADLSGIAAIEDVSEVYFRLVNTSIASANGGTVAGGGTSRIDNFTVMGTKISTPPVSTPDAGSSFLLLSLALGGLVGMHRRGMAH